MPDQARFERYQELQRYVGWTEEDAARVRSARELVRPVIPALIDDFYEEIERHPQVRAVITGGSEQIERLKGTLRNWLLDLLSGCYDSAYVDAGGGSERVMWRSVSTRFTRTWHFPGFAPG